MTVNGSHYHVEGFSRTGEIDIELTGFSSSVQYFVHKLAHLLTNHRVLIPVKEAMRVKLDEYPVRPPSDRYPSAAPPLKTFESKWIIPSKRPIINSRKGE